MKWKTIIKAKTYTYGRCQIQNGKGCIRPLQSRKARREAGSKPDGKNCMYCEDDTSRWALTPEGNLSSSELDKYVQKNPDAWRKLNNTAKTPYW